MPGRFGVDVTKDELFRHLLGLLQRKSTAPVAVFDHFADGGNLTTIETDLYSDSVPARAFANDGEKVEAEYGGVFVSSGTATRQVKVYFGGTAIFDTGALTLSLSAAWTCYVTIVRKNSTTVRYMVSLATEGAALSAYTAVGELGSLTLTASQTLKITGTAAGVGAASNDIVAKLGTATWFPSAALAGFGPTFGSA